MKMNETLFRYPMTEVEFMSSRLPGNFDPERAGKRLKLPTPETWETQLAK
jgi:telomerase protein component 1